MQGLSHSPKVETPIEGQAGKPKIAPGRTGTGHQRLRTQDSQDRAVSSILPWKPSSPLAGMDSFRERSEPIGGCGGRDPTSLATAVQPLPSNRSGSASQRSQSAGFVRAGHYYAQSAMCQQPGASSSAPFLGQADPFWGPGTGPLGAQQPHSVHRDRAAEDWTRLQPPGGGPIGESVLSMSSTAEGEAWQTWMSRGLDDLQELASSPACLKQRVSAGRLAANELTAQDGQPVHRPSLEQSLVSTIGSAAMAEQSVTCAAYRGGDRDACWGSTKSDGKED